MQAQTLGEVGILDTVLLRISSGTILPIFIEIVSYLTEKEQNISWHSFFLRHGVQCKHWLNANIMVEVIHSSTLSMVSKCSDLNLIHIIFTFDVCYFRTTNGTTCQL